MELQIPTVKMLLTYVNKLEVKRIICDFPINDNKSADINFEDRIISHNPFEKDIWYGCYPEVEQRDENNYVIIYWKDGEKVDQVYIFISYVLEFNNKYFLLEDIEVNDTSINEVDK